MGSEDAARNDGSIAMQHEAVIRDFHNGNLELDCSSMVLENTASGRPRVLRGQGYIRQDTDSGLIFRIYCDETARTRDFPSGRPENRAGRVLPREEYYRLTATDRNERLWKSDYVSPDVHYSQANRVMVSGQLGDGLVWTDDNAFGGGSIVDAALRITFWEQFEFPENKSTEVYEKIDGDARLTSFHWNAALFSSGAIEFLLKNAERVLSLTAKARSGSFPPHVEKRIVEAMQFAFAKPMRPATCFTREGKSETLRLYSPVGRPTDTKCLPPLLFRHAEYLRDNGADTYRVFDSYLRYVSSWTESSWHPLSGKVWDVIESSELDIDLQALGLAVAVEGVLNEAYSDLNPVPEHDADEIRAAVRLIKDSDLSRKSKDWICNRISSPLAPSALRKLRHLSQAGVVQPQHVEAWKELRNKWAHSDPRKDWLDEDELNLNTLQDVLDLISPVTVLFHHLVFNAIGYSGKYTDYSCRGFPTRHYPASAPEEGEQTQ